jgi:hypothetical protein
MTNARHKKTFTDRSIETVNFQIVKFLHVETIKFEMAVRDFGSDSSKKGKK